MADSINYQLAKFVASYGKVSQIPESTCPEVSFVGPPTWASRPS